MSVRLSDFSNDKFLVLKAMYSHQIKVGEDAYVPLSQAEIGALVGFSKPKTNQLMRELTDEGYISFYHEMRGKYTITESGLYVVRIFEGELTLPAAK